MNVLVRYPAMYGLDDISEIYPFSNFDETIGTMHEALKVGGYLAIYNSCYLVEHTSVAAKLKRIGQAIPKQNGWVDKYDRAGQRVAVASDAHGVPISMKAWRQYMFNNSHVGKIKNAYYVVKDGEQADCKTIIWQKIA
ncbi:hypothetical protein [Rhizobium herbae]|uniref:Methyltransferase n=1 Tax=Rhizobium herbae TaxID=508661 RepID=A0ABS4EGJ4_9HYPH|nr:hypothetical protein [Rhizobium herbae]MBP1857070.1 hypothetical protein [Rhizobium herbae]